MKISHPSQNYTKGSQETFLSLDKTAKAEKEEAGRPMS